MHGKIFKAHQNIGLNWLTRYVLFELNFEKKNRIIYSSKLRSSLKKCKEVTRLEGLNCAIIVFIPI